MEKKSTHQSPDWEAAFVTAAASDVGMRRQANQDSYTIVYAEDKEHWERSGHLLIVADGMGAHAAGELASRLSVDLIPHHYAKLNRGDAPEALLRAMEEANTEIYRRGQANPEFRSMGTTTSSLTILPVGAVIGHVGDSRIYRLRGQVFEQLTFDHSLVWEMNASGNLTEEAIRNNSIPKNVITRSLGPNASVNVDLEGPFPLKVGDRFLICSDGLCGQLTDEELGTLLQVLDLETAVRAMVDLANLGGGPDNITVVLGEVRSEEIIGTTGAPKWVNRPDGFPVAFGLVSATCGLASLVMLFLGQYPLTTICAAAAGIAFVSGWIKFQGTGSGSNAAFQFGKAPYRKTICKPNAEYCRKLLGLIRDLQEWVRESRTKVDASAIDPKLTAGDKALDAKNYRLAIQNYVDAIITIMREIKQRPTDEDDSAIEY